MEAEMRNVVHVPALAVIFAAAAVPAKARLIAPVPDSAPAHVQTVATE